MLNLRMYEEGQLTNNQVLIVDDDQDMREMVSTILKLEGYEVLEASNSAEMYQILENNKITLILLDLMLQGDDGLTIMINLQPEYDIPVIMLTGKGGIIDKVVGLEVGADDYITKPFHARELIARIRTVIRRHSPNVSPPSLAQKETKILSFCGFELDIYAHVLTNPDGVDIKITSHEYTILYALIKSAGRALSRNQLLNHLNTDTREWSPSDRSLDVLIAKIRKKLGDNPKSPQFIRTIRQTGYMFIATIRVRTT